MTVAGALLPRRWPDVAQAPGVARRFLVAPDNQVLARCHWQATPTAAPTVLMLHGLSGSASSNYMVGLGSKAFAAGFNVLRLNMRNCGDTEDLAESLYHAGLSSDVEVILDALAAEGHQSVYLVGFSMGGNVALRVTGGLTPTRRSLLKGVAVVSPSIDLALAVANIDRGWVSGLYRRSFMKHLHAVIRRKAQRFPGRYDLTDLRKVRTIYEFDDRFTAPSFGFGDAENYYRTASAMPLLPQVTTPTLMVQAVDDPMVPASQIAQVVEIGNPNITILSPGHGGHCGFVGAGLLRPACQADPDRHWAENRALQFFRTLASGDLS
jgi:predicted alpha/beta-fold hydrolase